MPNSVSDILAPTGPIAMNLGRHFEPRAEQLEMARAVARAMDTDSHLLVEAGTGVGKSFAYLVPAMLRCMERNEVVVIATNTIALQEQLMSKDVPLLESILDPGATDENRRIRPLLVKGRGNYVSVRRLKLASERQDRVFTDAAARRSLHQIEDWAMSTLDGTTSTLPALERPGIWDKVQSDSGNCMGRKCPTYDRCFYQQARAKLESANLLICNHAVFFSDLSLRAQEAGFLPAYRHVVFDEAHNIEDVASDHFGVSLAEGRIAHLLSTLHHSRTGKGYLSHLMIGADSSEAADRAIRLVDQAHGAMRAFFESLLDLYKRESGAGKPADQGHFSRSAAESGSLRIRRPGAVPNVLTPVLRELTMRLRSLRETVSSDADRYELNAYAIRTEQIAADAELLVSHALPAYAYWVEISGGDEEGFGNTRSQRVTFACSPIEVGPILKERLFKAEHSVTLTSATLATRTTRNEESTESAETAFAHTMARLGCEGARALQLGSPFDYANQAKAFIERGAQNTRRPSRGGRDEYDNPFFQAATTFSPMSEAIMKHVRATSGGAFVLFTSFATLERCASELAGPMSEEGYPLLAQGRDGSRTLILQRFRESDRSVLFGAASFWQGVDVRGRNLRNVIITKLPFDPPDRPLTQARSELIESRGGNPFMEDALPRALIKFKQGIGRLIRSATDTGRIVILDDRVVTARYGRLFLSAMPEGIPIEIAEDHSGDIDDRWPT